MVRCRTCNVFHMRQFCRFLYCLALFDTLNSTVCLVQTIWCTMIKLSLIDSVFIGQVWNATIDRAISTRSCSNCVCNSYCQNHHRNLPNFPWLSMIWYGWIQSYAASRRQDVQYWIFFRRFRYQLAMVSIPILIGLSWLLHAHIPYVIDIAKIRRSTLPNFLLFA